MSLLFKGLKNKLYFTILREDFQVLKIQLVTSYVHTPLDANFELPFNFKPGVITLSPFLFSALAIHRCVHDTSSLEAIKFVLIAYLSYHIAYFCLSQNLV